MLYWAAVFFVIAFLAAIFGFAGAAVGFAKFLFIVFLALAVISLFFGRRIPS